MRMCVLCNSIETLPLGTTMETPSNSATGSPASASAAAIDMIAACMRFAAVSSGSSISSPFQVSLPGGT